MPNYPEVEDQAILDQWQEVVEVAARLLHVPSAIITRVDPPMIQVFRASQTEGNFYSEGQEARMAGHYCQHVIESRQPLMVSDARESEEWRNAPEIKYSAVSYFGYPVRLPSGEVFGTLCVLDRAEHHYSEDDAALLRQLCGLVEAHLALACQKRQLEAQLAEIETLRGIIPICASCKKIRNDSGFWEQVEDYFKVRSLAEFSHSLCPTCEKKYSDEVMAEDYKN